MKRKESRRNENGDRSEQISFRWANTPAGAGPSDHALPPLIKVSRRPRPAVNLEHRQKCLPASFACPRSCSPVSAARPLYLTALLPQGRVPCGYPPGLL
jgi:hypothetical protein